MKLKNIFNFDREYLRILKFVAISAFVSVSIGFYFGAKDKVYIPEKYGMTREEYIKFMEVYDSLLSIHIKELDSDSLIVGAINGMLSIVDDPYTIYMNFEELKDFDESVEGKYEGIGAVVFIGSDGYPTIESAFKDSPAEKAGLMPLDKIVSVDNKDVKDMTLQEVVNLIKGPKGTIVKLGIKRKDMQELLYFNVKRDVIKIVSVESKLYKENNKKIGYIDILEFSGNTIEEMYTELNKLEREKIDGLIIDVRKNPGGYLHVVEEIASIFIDTDKNIYQLEYKNGTIKPQKSLIKGKKNYEIVVLIDEGSASGSEILAAALKESGGYEVIGTNSFGKGTVQTLIYLIDKSALKITHQKWLTPNGNWIHNKGVEPTIYVKQPDYFYYAPIGFKEELKYNDNNETVKRMQLILNALDYNTRVDGYFDKNTENVLKSFQKHQQLETTGTLNEITAIKLESLLLEKINDEKNDLQLKKTLEILSK